MKNLVYGIKVNVDYIISVVIFFNNKLFDFEFVFINVFEIFIN